MDYYFSLISGDVLTNFTNIVELMPCTAADSFDLYECGTCFRASYSKLG